MKIISPCIIFPSKRQVIGHVTSYSCCKDQRGADPKRPYGNSSRKKKCEKLLRPACLRKLHSALSKPLAAFPHNYHQNNSQS